MSITTELANPTNPHVSCYEDGPTLRLTKLHLTLAAFGDGPKARAICETANFLHERDRLRAICEERSNPGRPSPFEAAMDAIRARRVARA